MTKQRPNGYWSRERVMEESRNLFVDLEYLPTQKELRVMGYSALLGAITRYSSMTEVRQRLDLPVKRVGNGHWTEERILNECRGIIEEHGNLLTQKEFKKHGLGAIASQIESNGGYPYFREKLGLDLRKRPQGYWQNLDNVEDILNDIILDLGHFPTYKELQERGYGSVAHATVKYHGGINQVRQRMGYGLARRASGYWKNWSNLEMELSPIIEELGHFPLKHELEERSFGFIYLAINKHHGGLDAVRQRMGQSSERQQLEGLLEEYVGDTA